MQQKFIQTFKNSYIQTFDDSKAGRKNLVSVFPMSKYSMKREILEDMNKSGAGIFFTPNPCKDGRTESHVQKIEWVYVDMDNGTKEEMKEKIRLAPIRPHIIIESKRSYHIYWRIDLSHLEFSQIIKGLIHHFDGDRAISSTNEVLRFPGFLHMKDPNDPFMVKIIYFDNIESRVLTFEKMALAYPMPPEPEIVIKEWKNTDQISNIKDIPIARVLESLGIEVRNNFIWENGQETSASINEKENYINRFSGKPGSGSTIDAVMAYGNMTMPEAIKYLKKLAGISDIDIVLEKNKEVLDPINVAQKPFTWGTDELDKKISPISNDSFVIFAGESGSGKTAFSFDMAIKNAELGHKVLYISLEMSTDAIYTRVAREYAKITKEQWRDKTTIKDHQRARYERKKTQLREIENLSAVGFTNGVNPTIENIEELIKRKSPDIVFLDNFDLIDKSSELSTHDNENAIAKKILNICKSFPVPMVVIHHLKKGDDKDLKKPRGMHSVRGSGKIVHDSDILVLGFRPPYSENQDVEEMAKFTIIQLKDRDFGIGGFHICYFDSGTFSDKKPSDAVRYAEDVFGIK